MPQSASLDLHPAPADKSLVRRHHPIPLFLACSLGAPLAIALGAACTTPGSSPGPDMLTARDGSDLADADIPSADTPDLAPSDISILETSASDTPDLIDLPDTADLSDLSHDVDPLAACTRATRPLRLARALPYAEVGIADDAGWFLVDWGTTGSAIDPRAFVPGAPTPDPGTSDRWTGFDFFGPWSTVTLSPQDFSFFADPVPQAGILGTDFLSLDTYLVDWPASRLSRLDCSDATLLEAGFIALSSAGAFTDTPASLPPGTPNIPTVPVRFGDAPLDFPAQLDTGFDDAFRGPAININRALFDALPAGLLVRAPAGDLSLTTCVPGVIEPVAAYRVTPSVLTLVATDGGPALEVPEPWVFLKDTPPAAQSCGGIGTWSAPGAQLGVTAIARAARVIFDPATSRVWLATP